MFIDFRVSPKYISVKLSNVLKALKIHRRVMMSRFLNTDDVIIQCILDVLITVAKTEPYGTYIKNDPRYVTIVKEKELIQIYISNMSPYEIANIREKMKRGKYIVIEVTDSGYKVIDTNVEPIPKPGITWTEETAKKEKEVKTETEIIDVTSFITKCNYDGEIVYKLRRKHIAQLVADINAFLTQLAKQFNKRYIVRCVINEARTFYYLCNDPGKVLKYVNCKKHSVYEVSQ